MPLPSAEVRDAAGRRRSSAIEELLSKTQISARRARRRALRPAPPPARFSEQNPARRPTLEGAMAVLSAGPRATLDALQAAGRLRPSRSGRVEDKLVTAELRIRTRSRRDRCFRRTLAPAATSAEALQALDGFRQPVRDADGKVSRPSTDGSPEMGPSPREKEIAAIKAEFPTLSAELDELVAANDKYLARRTGLDDPAGPHPPHARRGRPRLPHRRAQPDRAEGRER
jgi:hypothetical protein